MAPQTPDYPSNQGYRTLRTYEEVASAPSGTPPADQVVAQAPRGPSGPPIPANTAKQVVEKLLA
jgi:hypothetical protein